MKPNAALEEQLEALGAWLRERPSLAELVMENLRQSPCPVVAERLFTSQFSVLNTLSRMTFRGHPVLIMAASLAVVGVFWVYWIYAGRSDYQGRPKDHAMTTVATLTAERECVWQTSSAVQRPQVGQRLRSADAILLRSGVAELTFADGAYVAIEGPCGFELQGVGKGYLRSGRLGARVPPRAVGFVVETPTARVVDLGTDFRLEASPKETKLAVFAGKVDLFPVNFPANGEKRIVGPARRVTEGQAVTIAAKDRGVVVVRGTKFDAEWLSAVALAPPPAEPPSTVVAYQVSKNVPGNRRDFSGGIGLDFDVRAPIRIFSLGVFDHLGDGIDPATSPTVLLWSRDSKGTPDDTSDDVGRAVLAVQKFTTGDSGELKLGHRFKSLSEPIELPVGSYSIVAYGLSDANPFIALENVDHKVDDRGFQVDATGANSGIEPNTPAKARVETSRGAIRPIGSRLSKAEPFTFPKKAGDKQVGYVAGSFEYCPQQTADRRQEPDERPSRVVAYQVSENVPGNRRDFPGGVGLDFDVRAPIRIFNLGVFDHLGDGIDPATSPVVQLWCRERNSIGHENLLLASLVFTAPDSGELKLGHRFKLLPTPLDLPVGSYSIVAYGLSDANSFITLENVDPKVDESGLRVSVPVANAGIEPKNPAVARVETSRGAIKPTGSRFDEAAPGTFPATKSDKQFGYVAGSFEYCPQPAADSRQ